MIFILWFQGWDTAPTTPKYALQRWKELNPEWTIVPLDTSSLQNWLNEQDRWILSSNISAQIASDYIRLCLLKDYGGIWVDARVIPQKPLSEWLNNDILRTGIFLYRSHIPGRCIASWFIATSYPNHLIVAKVYQSFYNAIQNPINRYDYYLFHHTFAECVINEDLWENVPCIYSDIAHTLQDRISRTIMNRDEYKERAKSAWMHKCDRFFLPNEDPLVEEILSCHS